MTSPTPSTPTPVPSSLRCHTLHPAPYTMQEGVVVVAGGWAGLDLSRASYTYSLATQAWTRGPDISHPRFLLEPER